MSINQTSYDRIYEIVRLIPKGQVATYGQIAELANLAGKARVVGYALYRVDILRIFNYEYGNFACFLSRSKRLSGKNF
jgi:hypothetical protein